MTLKRFSKNYRTFSTWLKAQSRDSRYAQSIIGHHERFPELSLRELRTLKISEFDMSSVPWDKLSSQQKRDRILCLEVQRSMRHGERLTPTLNRVGLSREHAIKHLGKNLTKSRGYWRVAGSDRIQAEMLMYDRDSGPISIVTTKSRDRTRIAKYFSEVRNALQSGDDSGLKRFRDMQIMDADGQVHRFETNLDRIYDLEEAQEEPEFLEIYRD